MRLSPEQKLKAMAPWLEIPPEAGAMLDVGCNAGEFLSHLRKLYPRLKLFGVEIDKDALEYARGQLPAADLRLADATSLPFPDAIFDCVSCMEVLEHIPVERRPQALSEMRRVLKPSGRLLLRVPHAGVFAFLDPANMRHRFPRLYRLLISEGLRDKRYPGGARDIVWHHHFSLDELSELAGPQWELIGVRRGGLFLLPLLDFLSWPFYRLGMTGTRLFRSLAALKRWDYDRDWGSASFDMLVVLQLRG